MMEIRSLSVSKGKKQILKNINLDIRPSEILAIVGTNGSGKSTLLNCIAGFETAKTGTVFLNEKQLSDYSQITLAQMRAFLSQQTYIYYPIKVLDVVMMGRFPYQSTEREQESKKIAEQILSDLGIIHFSNRIVNSLSGGEQQKVHLARVLTQMVAPQTPHHRFLLLDEPLKGLDLAQQHYILKHIKKAAKNGLGVVMVLHDLNLVAQYADRVIMIHNSEVLVEGTPEKVLSPKYIYTTYGVEVQVNPHPVSQRPMITVSMENQFAFS